MKKGLPFYLDPLLWKRESLTTLRTFFKKLIVENDETVTDVATSKPEFIEKIIIPFLKSKAESFPYIIDEVEDMCYEQYQMHHTYAINASLMLESPSLVGIEHINCTCFTHNIKKKLTALDGFLYRLQDVECWEKSLLLHDIKAVAKSLGCQGYSNKRKLEIICLIIDDCMETIISYNMKIDKNIWWDKLYDYLQEYQDNDYLFYYRLPGLLTPSNKLTTTTASTTTTSVTQQTEQNPWILSMSDILDALQDHHLYEQRECLLARQDHYDRYTQTYLTDSTTSDTFEIDHIVEQQVLATAIALAVQSHPHCYCRSYSSATSSSTMLRCLLVNNDSFYIPLKKLLHDINNLTVTYGQVNGSKGQVMKEFLTIYRHNHQNRRNDRQKMRIAPSLWQCFQSSSIAQLTDQVIQAMVEIMPNMIEQIANIPPESNDRWVNAKMFALVSDQLKDIMIAMELLELH